MAININNECISNNGANLDYEYGPYEGNNVSAALTLAEQTLKYSKVAGKTIGIKVNGIVTEYWYQPNEQEVLQLVEKQTASIKVDSALSSTSENPVQNKVVKSALDAKANASDIPSVPTISTNIESDASSDTKTASPRAVKTYVDDKMSSAYKAAGTASSVSNLGSLDASHEGFVYNMSAEFTTTADFVEGTGKTYPAGTNVAIVNVGTAQSPSYKYDVMAGFVDMSGYVQKSETTGLLKNDGNVDTQTAGKAASALQPMQSGQYTQGNIVIFDANGGLADSQKKTNDFATTAQGTKADNAIPMPTGSNGQILQKDSNEPSGVKWVEKPSAGATGKSAYQIARDNGFVGSEEQWLASLKATIGAFRFVDYDAVAAEEFTEGGIGTPYLGTVDSLEAGVNTDPSTILLMNNTDGTTPPTKTLMIATQEDSPATEQAPATYAFVYIGDLQDAMPSDILTADDLFKESDSEFDISDENGNIICQFNNGHIKTKYFNSEDTFNASSKAIIESGDNGLSSKVTISDLPNVRNSYVISLYSEILSGDTFNGIKINYDANTSIGYQNTTHIRGWVEIDGSEIRVLRYTGGNPSTTTETYTHSLTISDSIEVVIKPVAMHKAKLILYAEDGAYTIEEMPWYGCGGELSIEPLTGTSLTGHYEFGITYYGFNNKLWIFGDSWSDFWPGAMEKLGIKNFLLDGYGGRTSRQAATSFEKGLEFGKPSYVIWIMGMNDEDSLSEGAYTVSGDYKYPFEEMRMVCEELGIHFIPCTILCVDSPGRHNTGKNQYIKDSGLRYIPLAEELGGTADTDHGYKGLIEVSHPNSLAGSMKVALCLAKYISNIIKTD